MPAPKPVVSQTPWMDIAMKELGQREVSGSKANPRIVEYLTSTSLDRDYRETDETPWCAAFVTWVLKQAKMRNTKSAWARSYLKSGNELDKPQYGCIVVLERGQTSGHVGFFVEESEKYVKLLGGNQGNKVSLADYPKTRVLSYRWPVKEA